MTSRAGWPKRCGECEICVDSREATGKETCIRIVAAVSAAHEPSCPLSATKRESKPPVPSEPAETLRVRNSQLEASRCAGSSVALAAAAETDNFAAAQAEQADPEGRSASRSLSGRLARSRLAKLGRLVTLVPQLLEAEDQAEKADETGAQATAAVLASVQVPRDDSEPPSPRSVGEGLDAPQPCAAT
jgi:hypothetical protein